MHKAGSRDVGRRQAPMTRQPVVLAYAQVEITAFIRDR